MVKVVNLLVKLVQKSKTSDSHKLICNLLVKINLKRNYKYISL